VQENYSVLFSVKPVNPSLVCCLKYKWSIFSILENFWSRTSAENAEKILKITWAVKITFFALSAYFRGSQRPTWLNPDSNFDFLVLNLELLSHYLFACPCAKSYVAIAGKKSGQKSKQVCENKRQRDEKNCTRIMPMPPIF